MAIDWTRVLYNSGDVFLPKQIKELLDTTLYASENKSFYVNGWTFIHIFSGILFGYLYLYIGYPKSNYFYNMLVLHTLWELWQILIGMSKPFTLTGHNNRIDIFVDTIAFMCGSYITKSLF